jgi:hypothetical protein
MVEALAHESIRTTLSQNHFYEKQPDSAAPDLQGITCQNGRIDSESVSARCQANLKLTASKTI